MRKHLDLSNLILITSVLTCTILLGWMMLHYQTLRQQPPGQQRNASHTTYQLPFRSATITLTRKQSPSSEASFWNLPIRPANLPSGAKIDTLYQHPDWNASVWYDVASDTFYELEPGGYRVFQVISSPELPKRLPPKEEIDEESSTLATTICSSDPHQLGDFVATELSCTKTVTNLQDRTHILDTSTTTNCYLPISADTWLAYEQPVKPTSSTVNTCAILDGIGVQDIHQE